MGTLTLADFRSELTFLLKDRADAAVANARLDRWINHAYTHLTHPAVHKHWEMQEVYDLTLVTGTQSYSLAEGTVGFVLRGIRNATYYYATSITPTGQRRDLRPKSIHWVYGRPAPTGGPTGYALEAASGVKRIIFDTSPGSTESGRLVRLHCWRAPTRLSAATDTTVLEDYWDRVLLKGSQWMAEVDLGYREVAEGTKQDYVGLINEVWNDFQLNAEDTGFRSDVIVDSPMENG